MILTMAEIRDLALFCGFTVDGNGAETRDAEELETEIAVEAVDHGIKDDDGTEHRYAKIAWYEEYPDEGAMGLGPELPNAAVEARRNAVASDGLLAAAIAVREYLESTAAICCSKFDVPDAVWVPFCKAIDAANAPAEVRRGSAVTSGGLLADESKGETK